MNSRQPVTVKNRLRMNDGVELPCKNVTGPIAEIRKLLNSDDCPDPRFIILRLSTGKVAYLSWEAPIPEDIIDDPHVVELFGLNDETPKPSLWCRFVAWVKGVCNADD